MVCRLCPSEKREFGGGNEGRFFIASASVGHEDIGRLLLQLAVLDCTIQIHTYSCNGNEKIIKAHDPGPNLCDSFGNSLRRSGGIPNLDVVVHDNAAQGCRDREREGLEKKKTKAMVEMNEGSTDGVAGDVEGGDGGVGEDEGGEADEDPVLEDAGDADGEGPGSGDDEEDGEVERESAEGVGEEDEQVERLKEVGEIENVGGLLEEEPGDEQEEEAARGDVVEARDGVQRQPFALQQHLREHEPERLRKHSGHLEHRPHHVEVDLSVRRHHHTHAHHHHVPRHRPPQLLRPAQHRHHQRRHRHCTTLTLLRKTHAEKKKTKTKKPLLPYLAL